MGNAGPQPGAEAGQARALPQGRHIAQDTISIAAPRDAVWAILMDFAGWKAWNPLYPETSGSFVAGSRIGFTVRLPGLAPQRGKATVLSVEPGRFIAYQVRAMGGLGRATRFIALEEPAPGMTRVVNGEIMGGAIGWLLFKAVGAKVRDGLAGMNLALKQVAEGRRADDGDKTKGNA